MGTNASVEAFGFSSGRPFLNMVKAMSRCLNDQVDFDRRMELVKSSRYYYTYDGHGAVGAFLSGPHGQTGGYWVNAVPE